MNKTFKQLSNPFSTGGGGGHFEAHVQASFVDWVNAGAHVQETVAALSQQLRRYVDENFLEEERRINQLVREIEGKAVAIRNTPPPDWSMEIDG
ncbi:MAG: DUF3375 family protein [Desulfosporosinus sp.]|nr:DUF3375 family protein [Desulfosporosinus sp.]